jgi:hypothetical protein
MAMEKRTHYSRLVIAVALLLSFMYVITYLALVVPEGILHPRFREQSSININQFSEVSASMHYYRLGGNQPRKLFWPLECLDRKIRPGSWYSPAGLFGSYDRLG